MNKSLIAISPLYNAILTEIKNMDARSQVTSVTGTSWDLKGQAAVEESSEARKLNDQGDIDSAALAKVAGPSFRLQTAAPLDKTALKAWPKFGDV